MKRIVMVEVDVEDVTQLRQVARSIGYAAWALLGEDCCPVVKMATSADTTMALRTAWEAIP